MEFEQAKARVEELVPLLQYYTQKYFDDEQVVSDYEYDMLMKELKGIEAKFPELIRKDSPTQKVGASLKKGFEKVTHEVPLQSLQDVFSFEEVRDFDERMKKIAEENNTELEYVVETKIDGLSAALEYKNGVFVRGATRGNGTVGEDVTGNLRTVKSIPKKLSEPIDIIVRGEVFIGKEQFEKLNENRLMDEEEQFANARNAAAGSLRQLDSKITATRPLDIYIFNVQKSDKKEFKTICDLGQERIRRVANKLKQSNSQCKDLGFRVYKTDSSNMKDIFYKPNDLEQSQLRLFESNIKEDRTTDDLLTQVILDLGLTLDLDIEERMIGDNKVYYVAGNSLVACFDDNIDINIVDKICECEPYKVVFKDSAFKYDNDKINLEERFKKLLPQRASDEGFINIL